jgi:hypothetical protein
MMKKLLLACLLHAVAPVLADEPPRRCRGHASRSFYRLALVQRTEKTAESRHLQPAPQKVPDFSK